jgi:hypothetical protein
MESALPVWGGRRETKGLGPEAEGSKAGLLLTELILAGI